MHRSLLLRLLLPVLVAITPRTWAQSETNKPAAEPAERITNEAAASGAESETNKPAPGGAASATNKPTASRVQLVCDKTPNLEIVAQKAKRTRVSGKSDYDDKTETFQFTVKVRNREPLREFTGLTADLYVYGKSIRNDWFRMLDRTNATFNLSKGGEFSFQGRAVVLQYDDHATMQYGVKYEGYVIAIKDSADKVVLAKSVKPAFLKILDKMAALEIDDAFDKTGKKLEHAYDGD
jgi:hypothetical protein